MLFLGQEIEQRKDGLYTFKDDFELDAVEWALGVDATVCISYDVVNGTTHPRLLTFDKDRFEEVISKSKHKLQYLMTLKGSD